jgi:UDP:flavonoid glycosyltransferase YjiC (YdhE family)
MQIAIIAFGTQGDVQPYVALGKGLRAAGYSVRVVTHQNFEQLVVSHGLDFYPVTGSVQEILESEEMRALLEKGSFFAVSRRTSKEAERSAVLWARESLDACRETNLLVAGIGGLFFALALAEKLKIPLLQAHLVPFTPTKEFPAVILPASLPKLGASFNRLSHRIIKQAMWQGSRAADNLARREVLDLPPAPFWGPYNSNLLRKNPILYGFSPSVIPKPSEWNSDTHVTGYWFLDSADDWTPPAELSKFLANGAPPVYIGFGSMSSRKPEETVDLILAALTRTRQRAVLLAGWSGLRKENLPETVFMASSTPHSWLFPRVSAVIHHGGAGTTAAGFRAGVPSLMIPFFADQPFWGQKAWQIGVGTKPVPRKQLTTEKLANALQILTDDETMRRKAAELGEKIRAENGIPNAVSVITKFLNSTQ